MLHHLREHELAQVHPYLPRAARPQDGPVPRRRRGSNRQLDEGSISKCFSTTYHDRSAQRWDTTVVIYLFIRWRGTGRRTAAVSLPEKDPDGGGKTPLNGTIAEAGKAVGPSAVKEIQRPDETGRSAAASMSQESAHGSLPTYGELFPEIVSMKTGNSG